MLARGRAWRCMSTGEVRWQFCGCGCGQGIAVEALAVLANIMGRRKLESILENQVDDGMMAMLCPPPPPHTHTHTLTHMHAPR